MPHRQENGGRVGSAQGLKSVADHSLADRLQLDYLLIPGGFAEFDEMKNDRLVDWVRNSATKATHVLSVCTGSFTLHAAGLLEGRKATTHWNVQHQRP